MRCEVSMEGRDEVCEVHASMGGEMSGMNTSTITCRYMYITAMLVGVSLPVSSTHSAMLAEKENTPVVRHTVFHHQTPPLLPLPPSSLPLHPHLGEIELDLCSHTNTHTYTHRGRGGGKDSRQAVGRG